MAKFKSSSFLMLSFVTGICLFVLILSLFVVIKIWKRPQPKIAALPLANNLNKETPSWAQYTNDKYKVSFKYPHGEYLTETADKDQVYLTENEQMKQELEKCLSQQRTCTYSLRIELRNYDKPKDISLDEAVHDYIGYAMINGYTIQPGGRRSFHEIRRDTDGFDYLFVDLTSTVLWMNISSKYNQSASWDNFSKMIETMQFRN